MIERRRFNRVSSNARVAISICDLNKNNLSVNSPIMGRITDFTPHGVCLLLEKTRYDRRHIFYTTQNHGNHIIRLEYPYPTDDKNNSFVIYGNFAWYARCEADSANVKLGIEFLADQDEDILLNFIAELGSYDPYDMQHLVA